MKRRMALLVAVLVIAVSVMTGWATASYSVLEIKLPDNIPTTGDKFTVSVELGKNAGFSSISFSLMFDGSKLDCTAVQAGELLKGMVSALNPSAGLGEACIAAASLNQKEGDGTVATFTFTVLRDVTEINMWLSNVYLADGNDEQIAVDLIPESPTDTLAQPETASFETSTGVLNEDITSQNSGSHAVEQPAAQAIGQTSPQANSGIGERPIISESSASVTIFNDTSGHWGEKWITAAAEKGLFGGYPDGSFRPDASMTRAQFVALLYRMAGSPNAGLETPFKDIGAQNNEFQSAISWAYSKRYIGGRSPTSFDPDGQLTRQEAMKILFNYAGGVRGMEVMFGATYDETFSDSGSIAGWAKPAMYWAYYNGVIGGMSEDTLGPEAHATRAQLAKILVGYLNEQEGARE